MRTPRNVIAIISARRRPIRHGLTLAGLMVGVVMALSLGGRPIDAHAYFAASPADPYNNAAVYREGAFLYSPAFLQVVHPLTVIGWPDFLLVWRLAIVFVVVALAGPFALPVLFFEPVLIELNTGNIHAFMALVIVAGFRWPAAWAFMLLTKVTPGVGLLWFAVRREWRHLALALGALAAITVVSFALAPNLWFGWVGVLTSSANTGQTAGGALGVPLPLRLVIAALIVVWGARSNRRWVMPVAILIALPVLYPHAPTVLLAMIPLLALPTPAALRAARVSVQQLPVRWLHRGVPRPTSS